MALTNVVVRGEPFQFTIVSLVNVVPFAAFTVRVIPAGLQYGVELGESELLSRLKPEIVNVSAGVDVPPPGAGLKTVTFTVPADARSEADTGTLSCVGLTYVVARAVPFH